MGGMWHGRAQALRRALRQHRFREAELKHGRVAMLAVFGMITADKFHPLFGGQCSSNPLLALTQVMALRIGGGGACRCALGSGCGCSGCSG